jgi:hypothetical protein
MDFKAFKDFNYFGIYVYASLNEKNELKKYCYQPKAKLYENIKHYNKPVWNYHLCEQEKPNGIQIDTSNISTIDVDQPEKCETLVNRLIEDCKFYVKTKKGYHFYFNKEDKLPRDKKCGIIDFNLQKLWYVPEYHFVEFKDIEEDGKKQKEYIIHNDKVYKYELIKNEKLVDMPQYAIDYCQMIYETTKTDDDKPKEKKNYNTEKIVIDPSKVIEKFDIDVMKTIIKIFYNAKYLNSYNTWRDTGYMLRHLNNSQECFKYFDKYCRKVEGYEKAPEANNSHCFYGNNSYNENFNVNGVLFKCSKLNPQVYKEKLQFLRKSTYDEQIYKFNKKFIYDIENEDNNKMFSKWMTDYKALCIKSPYGTGKTLAFKKLIEKYQYKRILFITYRQSLAHSLSEDLKKSYGFFNYLDGELNNNPRLIIQLDSLRKLVNNGVNIITQKDGAPRYDLVVLDECEGLLSHLSFDKIEQYLIHSILTRIIKKSEKILVLDGDMGDRTYDFITTLDFDYRLYVNEYKGIQKKFIFGYDMSHYDAKIDKDLKDGKKIVIVSMTKTESEKYYNLYKDKINPVTLEKYKIIIHNSIEKNKNILLNVNEEWAKCDLLIYSPTVESGVDFNIKDYFDKCYATISNASTSYRAFFQMLNRVRYYKTNIINVLVPFNIPWNWNSQLITFDDMKLNKWNNIETTNLSTILIHNDVERFNSQKYLIASILQTLKNKGHTYEYLKDRPEKKQSNGQTAIIKENILKSKNINDDEFNEIIKRQQQNKDINRNETYEITKMFYKKVFMTDNIDEDFIETHYNKLSMVSHFKLLTVPKEDRKKYLTDIIRNTHYYIDDTRMKEDKLYFNQLKINKLEMLDGLLRLYNYELKGEEINKIDDKKVIVYDTDFKNEVKKYITDSKFRFVFNFERDISNNNIPYAVNEIIDNYGLKMTSKSGKLPAEEKGGKRKSNPEYTLQYNEIISGYIERRNEKIKQEEEQKKKAEINKIELQKWDEELNNLNNHINFVDYAVKFVEEKQEEIQNELEDMEQYKNNDLFTISFD